MIRLASMLATALVFLSVQSVLWSVAANADEPKLVGEYVCNGTQSNDRTYSIMLSIAPMDESLYLSWTKDGKQVYEGIGLIVDGYLSAISVGHNGQSLVASAVIYKIDNGRLHGTWTGGDGHLYHETCKRGTSNL